MAAQTWKLEKKVSIGFLAAFIGYGVSAVWVASALYGEVRQLRQENVDIKKILADRGKVGEIYFSRLDRLEVRFDGFEKVQTDMAGNIKLIMERQYNESPRRK